MIARAALVAGLMAVPAATFASDVSLRPQLRPQGWEDAAVVTTAALVLPDPDLSLRPATRPAIVAEQALFKRRMRRKGAVCGDIDIQGKEVGAISGNLTACGSTEAVRVTSISGVALSTPSLMECDTAKALNKWVTKGVQPAFKRVGKVVSLRVAAHYSCRTRNNQPGAKLSEHGKARAIDISGFTLEGGETVTVLGGWQDAAMKARLQKAWKAACGPFQTVLGPAADRYHQDHFHLDTAKRGGRYCR